MESDWHLPLDKQHTTHTQPNQEGSFYGNPVSPQEESRVFNVVLTSQNKTCYSDIYKPPIYGVAQSRT